LEKTYFFTRAGGGVLGITAGTDQDTTTEIGLIIPISRLSRDMFLPIGDRITGIKRGMDIAGNPSGGHIRISNAIGMSGKKTGTGINKAMALKK